MKPPLLLLWIAACVAAPAFRLDAAAVTPDVSTWGLQMFDTPPTLVPIDDSFFDADVPSISFGTTSVPTGLYLPSPILPVNTSGLSIFTVVQVAVGAPPIGYVIDVGTRQKGFGLSVDSTRQVVEFYTSLSHGGVLLEGRFVPGQWHVIAATAGYGSRVSLEVSLLNGTVLSKSSAQVSLSNLGPSEVAASELLSDSTGGPMSIGIQSVYPRADRYLKGALAELELHTEFLDAASAATRMQGMRDRWRGRVHVQDAIIPAECPVEEVPQGLPRWLTWCLVAVLVVLSALFSGLTLGLMGLDPIALTVLMDEGEPQERRHAKKIFPVRNKGNLLLCTLLLGNVVVNASLSILMADIAGGLLGLVVSSGAIVVFGEITPQAICSRHGLAIGAATLPIVYFFMFITFPLAYPISKILDVLLGQDMGMIYQKTEMAKLLRIHAAVPDSDITKGEATILESVLQFDKKVVDSIMTPAKDVFMLSMTEVLDYPTLERIMASGHSRVPVYEGERSNITSLLVVKHLALLNPQDKVPVQTLVKFYGKKVCQMWADDTLEKALSVFKQIGTSHLATVRRVVHPDVGDPFYEMIGIVTLEDVIEELISCEIVDETDVYVDNTRQKRLGGASVFTLGKRQTGASMDSQLREMVCKFLSTIAPFDEKIMSPDVLRNFVEQCQVVEVPEQPPDFAAKDAVYARGVRNKYFTVVLQGELEVRAGSDEFKSSTGPWTHFGVNVLLKPDLSFVPDFTIRITERAVLWRCTVDQYNSAVVATQVERGERDRRLSAPPPLRRRDRDGERGNDSELSDVDEGRAGDDDGDVVINFYGDEDEGEEAGGLEDEWEEDRPGAEMQETPAAVVLHDDSSDFSK